jgi:hypothetical protein
VRGHIDRLPPDASHRWFQRGDRSFAEGPVTGWFFVSRGNFGAFNASGGSLYSAIGLAAGIALFSFIGVETAAITARRVRDTARNLGPPR